MSAASRVSALIAAAGEGTRLGLGPKALLRLGDRSLLERVVALARRVCDEIVVAAPPNHLEACRSLVGDGVTVIAGAAHRNASLARAFAHASGDWLMVLDVTRPFVSERLARAVLAAAREHGAAGAFLSADVPAALPGVGAVDAQLAADDYRLPQLPQVLRRDLAARVFAADDLLAAQTLWQAGLRNGVTFAAVPGESRNIKITHALDWAIARQVIAPMIDQEETP